MASITKRVLTDDSAEVLYSAGLGKYIDVLDLDMMSDIADALFYYVNMEKKRDEEITRLEALENENDEMRECMREIDFRTAGTEHDYHFDKIDISEVITVLQDVNDIARVYVKGE